MSDHNYSVRADDFRNAWPIAYQLCMSQVADVVRLADSLLVNCNVLAKDTKRFSTESGAEFKLIVDAACEKLKGASEANAAAMETGVNRLLEATRIVVTEERKLRAQTQAATEKLARERMEFEQVRDEFRNLTLWKRLLMATKSEGVYL